VTSSSIPRPSASPLTNSVFPAPRSPIKLRTVPAGAFLTNSEPMNRVSSGLLEKRCAFALPLLREMIVPLSQELGSVRLDKSANHR